MNKKVTGIFAYLGIIFWLIAFLAGDKEGAKFHLNQGLVLFLFMVVLGVLSGVLSVVPLVGGIVACVGYIVWLVFVIMGIVSVCKDEEKELPLIGKIHLLK